MCEMPRLLEKSDLFEEILVKPFPPATRILNQWEVKMDQSRAPCPLCRSGRPSGQATHPGSCHSLRRPQQRWDCRSCLGEKLPLSACSWFRSAALLLCHLSKEERQHALTQGADGGGVSGTCLGVGVGLCCSGPRGDHPRWLSA